MCLRERIKTNIFVKEVQNTFKTVFYNKNKGKKERCGTQQGICENVSDMYRVIFMAVPNKEYDKMAKKASPPSPKGMNMINAFCVGGLICALGEGLSSAYEAAGIGEKGVKALVAITLIVITAVLTAIGVFDTIAKHAGAGTIVPITGFANSVVSPALEFQSEGKILGTGAEMFKIAGPVIVYGSAAAVIYGFIYWIVERGA